MASTSLRLPSSPVLRPKPKTPTKPTHTLSLPIRCGGPRSNRGPLVKGRILSSEAILAIQSLKRSSATNKSPPPNLSRLIRPDLISILRELLRQDHCTLALRVLSTLRTEFPDHPPGLDLYADVIFSLMKNKMGEEIDKLVEELEGLKWEGDKGLVRVVRGVVEAERKESTVGMVGILRRSGCGDTWMVDEYVVKVLSKGLRRMGEEELANEVEKEIGKEHNFVRSKGICK